jgi:iron complex outermembrane recepter protein
MYVGTFMKPCPVTGILIAVMSFVGATCHAQTATPTPPAGERPAGTQTAPADANTPPHVTEVVVVTGSRTEANVNDLPVSVQVATRREIESKTLSNPNVGEAVRDMPGVSVGHGNRNIPPWIQLRGTGYFIGRTLYMVDELPLAEPMVSIAALPANLGSVEVLLGPSSSLYGANASGGTVNMRSLSGRAAPGLAVGVGYGTFDTWRPEIAAGGLFGGWDLYGSYHADTSAGYRNTDLATGVYLMQNGQPSYLNSVAIDPQDYTNQYLYQRVGYQNPATGLRFTAGAHVFHERLSAGRANNFSTGTRIIGTGSVAMPLGTLAVVTARLGYQSRDGDTQSTKGLQKVANSAINGRYVFTAIDAANSYIYDATISQYSTPRATRLPLDVQMDLKPVAGQQVTGGVTYLNDDSHSITLSADRASTLARTDYGINQTAVFLQDRIDIPGNVVSLTVGLRRDWWRYHDVYDTGSTNREPPDVDKAATTYRGGVRVRVSDAVGLRASAGTAFWPGNATWFFQNVSTGVTWREANPDLKPESTRMVDGGFDYTPARSRFRLSATGYVGRITDAISYVYAQHPTLPGVQIIRTSNSDEVDIKGMELAATWNRGGLRVFGNYTLNRSRITKSATNAGHQLRNAPDNLGGAGLSYADAAHGWGGAIQARYSDSRYYDDENTHLKYFAMDAYATVGVKVWKDVRLGGQSLNLSVGCDNLFNSHYDGEFIYNAPGRFVEARATWRLGR